MKRETWTPIREDGSLDRAELTSAFVRAGAANVEVCDIFARGAPPTAVCAVFGVMAGRPHTTFWLATTDPKAMAAWFKWTDDGMIPPTWPLANVRLGLRAQSQDDLDEGMRHLNDSPSEHWWLDLVVASKINLDPPHCQYCYLAGLEEIGACEDGTPWCTNCDSEAGFWRYLDPLDGDNESGVSHVRLRGETGPEARPLHPAWARAVRDQCAAEGVAFEFAGWGEWNPRWHEAAVGQTWRSRADAHFFDDGSGVVALRQGTTRCDQRELDGREHDGEAAP